MDDHDALFAYLDRVIGDSGRIMHLAQRQMTRSAQARLAVAREWEGPLRELSARLAGAATLQQTLEETLAAGIELQGADFGNIQLYDHETATLSLAVHRGFGEEFLDQFRVVDVAADCACGRALRAQERIVIEDVRIDGGFAPHRAIAARAGFRAVQSTPLFGHDDRLMGVLSTHFQRPSRPSALVLQWTDLYLRVAERCIERHQAQEGACAADSDPRNRPR